MQNDEKRIAVFIDFENVAMGVRESNYGDFNINLVLKRVVEKGKILVKRAYSDWHRYSEFKRAFHQAAIELIDVPQTRYSGKNSADIRMVVDALDLSYQKEHIDTFVLVSGDSDFSPLVSKLRENGRYVIGVGVKQSSSDLLVNNCDEFIYYEDLVRPATSAADEEPKLRNLPQKRAEALRLVLETFEAMQREGKEAIYGSMIKQTLLRKLPSFNESYYGYPMFSRLLEDAAENKLLRITKDQKSGGYIVSPYAETVPGPAAVAGPTNGDSTKIAVPELAQGESGASQGPSAGIPRERGRRPRWGRGRTYGPQRRPESFKPEPAGHTPAELAPSPVTPVEPTPSQIASEATPGTSPVVPEVAPVEAPVPESPVTADQSSPQEGLAVESPPPVAAEQGPQPGRSRYQGRWERGRRRFGRRPVRPPAAQTPALTGSAGRPPTQSPAPEPAAVDMRPEVKPEPEPRMEEPVSVPEPPAPVASEAVGTAQPPVTHEAKVAAKRKPGPKPVQRTSKKNPATKKTPPKRSPKK